jgi:ParB-like chromosome segregation protein Spo0J
MAADAAAGVGAPGPRTGQRRHPKCDASEQRAQLVPLADLTLDADLQPRVVVDEAVVEEYREQLADGAVFPPVTVYRVENLLLLVDGWHRVAAARRAGLLEVEAEVRVGTREDAILAACGANAHHGLRRTNADKRRSVHAVLRTEWARGKSCREVARACGVSHEFARRAQAEVSTVDSMPLADFMMQHRLRIDAMSSPFVDKLRESIRTLGVLHPIIVDQDGLILDGYWRQRLADEVGAPCPRRVIPCNTEEERLQIFWSANLIRLDMTPSELAAKNAAIEAAERSALVAAGGAP